VSREKIVLKSPDDAAKMRAAGIVLARTLQHLRDAIALGVSTWDLDVLARDEIAKAGGVPTFLNYRADPSMRPFPAAICASINEEVVHGIPDKGRRLREGDVVSIDCGVTLDGWVADAAFTKIVGRGRPDDERLLAVTEGSLMTCIAEACHVGKRLFDVAYAVESYVVSRGFRPVEKYGGHGLGRTLHEPPFIPNEVTPGLELKLKAGMTLAIEPMVTGGSGRVKVLRDGWTVVTAERKNAAHFEHTVFLTDDGPVILTLPE
jgi:methionyl aminopeptidase